VLENDSQQLCIICQSSLSLDDISERTASCTTTMDEVVTTTSNILSAVCEVTMEEPTLETPITPKRRSSVKSHFMEG
jgi:hypothetical protein